MTVLVESIDLKEYTYELPEEKIAKFPLDKRDESKLLVYRKGEISHQIFHQLPESLPADSLLIFNNTKVIPARLHFIKNTGAVIEVFLLQAEEPKLATLAMRSKGACLWKCLIGNKKRWKKGEILCRDLSVGTEFLTLKAELQTQIFEEAKEGTGYVLFSWDNETINFTDILATFGEIPLPPYLHRKATDKDREQYQTVYSKEEGAVAAPTAGLHFTKEVFKNLENKGIQKDFITLHVSGATFQPIKTQNIIEHPMHAEQLIYSRETVKKLLDKSENIIAVGTTSLRALESLYWFGLKLFHLKKSTGKIPFFIEKLYPYQGFETLPKLKEALKKVLDYMEMQEIKELIGETEIMIFPGYQFRVCKALISNYHQPNSTLILLVAAFIGQDWKKVYAEALANNYRFLSYGDSSLLMR